MLVGDMYVSLAELSALVNNGQADEILVRLYSEVIRDQKNAKLLFDSRKFYTLITKLDNHMGLLGWFGEHADSNWTSYSGGFTGHIYMTDKKDFIKFLLASDINDRTFLPYGILRIIEPKL